MGGRQDYENNKNYVIAADLKDWKKITIICVWPE